MNKVNFFNGMEPLAYDFNDVEIYFEERINRNQSCLTDKGVFVNADLPDGTVLEPPYISADTKTLSIYGFVAYNNEGKLLYLAPSFIGGIRVPSIQNLKPIDDSTSTLSNRQLVNTGNTVDFGANVSYVVVARYSEEYTGEKREQEDTNILIPSRIKPTVEFYLRDSDNIAIGDVVLGTITTDNFGTVSVDESLRDNLTVRGDLIVSDISTGDVSETGISYSQHINMLGSGVYSTSNPHAISPEDLGIDPTATGRHQLYEHSNGLKSTDINSGTSALAYQFTSTSEDSILINVQAISSDYDEMVAIGDTVLFPSDFAGAMSLTLSQVNGIGYYIVSLTQNGSLQLDGPFSAEDDAEFIGVLNTRNLFPICSFYWGTPRAYNILFSGILENSETTITNWAVLNSDKVQERTKGDILASEVEINDELYYSESEDYLKVNTIRVPYGANFLTTSILDESSIKDRRTFNNISFKDIHNTDLAIIRTNAPIYNETSSCYNALVVSNKSTTAFNLGGLTLQIEFDGSLCSSPLTFPSDIPFFPISSVVSYINSWINNYYVGRHTQDGNLPRAFINHEGKLAIYSVDSIVIQDSPLGAEDELGFSSDNSSDLESLLRVVVTTGALENIQEYYYDSDNNLTNIFYTLSDSSIKKTSITYNTNGMVLNVEGE